MLAVTAALFSNEIRKMTQESSMHSHDIALVVKAKNDAKISVTAKRQKKPLSGCSSSTVIGKGT